MASRHRRAIERATPEEKATRFAVADQVDGIDPAATLHHRGDLTERVAARLDPVDFKSRIEMLGQVGVVVEPGGEEDQFPPLPDFQIRGMKVEIREKAVFRFVGIRDRGGLLGNPIGLLHVDRELRSFGFTRFGGRHRSGREENPRFHFLKTQHPFRHFGSGRNSVGWMLFNHDSFLENVSVMKILLGKLCSQVNLAIIIF